MIDGCLSTEALVGFLAGHDEPSTRARIAQHASRCASCREILSALARSATPHDPTRPQAQRDVVLAPGTQVGRYAVTRELGTGGMGVVYAARDPELDRVVAIKLLRATDPRMQERLRREAQAMAQLTHPNVVQAYDVGSFEQRTFVAMEYVPGETLAHWLATPRPWREILDVYRAAGSGLCAAHAAGIVHRDFKPENVMLGHDGRVRVGDFGLARTTGAVDALRAATHSRDAWPLPSSPAERAVPTLPIALTAPGTLLGTPYYIAPELYGGAEADARSDQFSFCVALFSALYGERPFHGATLDALAGNVRAGRVRVVSSASRVPRRVRAAILRGLAVDPAARFASLDKLLAELVVRRPAARWTIGLAAALALGLVVLGWRIARPAAGAELPVGWKAIDAAIATAPSLIINPDGGPCPRGFACVYQDANRRGFGIGIPSGASIPDLLHVSCPSCGHRGPPRDGTFDDQMTSWENRSGRRYCWGVDAGARPTDHTMGDEDVTNVLAGENDTASSVGPC